MPTHDAFSTTIGFSSFPPFRFSTRSMKFFRTSEKRWIYSALFEGRPSLSSFCNDSPKAFWSLTTSLCDKKWHRFAIAAKAMSVSLRFLHVDKAFAKFVPNVSTRVDGFLTFHCVEWDVDSCLEKWVCFIRFRSQVFAIIRNFGIWENPSYHCFCVNSRLTNEYYRINTIPELFEFQVECWE